MTTVQHLFGEFPLARFLAEYYQRLPLALPRSSLTAVPTASWATVETALGDANADIVLAKDGCSLPRDEPRHIAEIQALSSDGWTTVLRHAERYDAQLADLAGAFDATFRAPIDMQLFITPPGCPGFSWHYDAEEVFILQTGGAKEYFLRKNSVNPWPVEETLPADMRYEREIMPLLRVVLTPGDLLYIPCGHWHRAKAVDERAPSISLAIGVMAPAAIDVLAFLRPRLIQSLVWRQRLPLETGDESTHETYRRLLRSLVDDLHHTLAEGNVVDAVVAHFAAPPAPTPQNCAPTKTLAGQTTRPEP